MLKVKVPASKIVRALDTLSGRDSIIFNDKTMFGRSIKVWGWSAADYADARAHLEDAGYKVKIVKTPKTAWSRGNTRLHIFEVGNEPKRC